MLLAERFRGAVALRMLFFLPYVLAEIAAGLIWSFVYDGNYGLLASIWRLFGAEAPHLLAEPADLDAGHPDRDRLEVFRLPHDAVSSPACRASTAA